MTRRKFLKTSILSGVATGSFPIITWNHYGISNQRSFSMEREDCMINNQNEEILYNGISITRPWPPENMRSDSYDPMPLPYLTNPPEIIPIDTGRQLFVDDFLIEYTSLQRKFHQPVKYWQNPVLQPVTKIEMNKGFCPVAAPFSDGCFYDPNDKLFKLWYMAGWFDGTAMAVSSDGLHWVRRELDVVAGTNLVLPLDNDLRRDGASIWLDHEAQDISERYKMYLYTRKGKTGEKLIPHGAYLLTSPDGINWKWGGLITGASDNNTFFYNPFRRKWVFTIRKEGRPYTPWSNPLKTGNGRARSYWESSNFPDALNKWESSVFWMGADRLDKKRNDYDIGDEPQIYKIDAAGYESIILGLIQLHYGPSNEVCATGGFPKLTELQVAFNRDGFHWDRSCRDTFIGANPGNKESWERAYIHSTGGVCNIVGDKLHFYYSAFRGDESNRNKLQQWSGMYANASTGLAILRRDGFASMESEGLLLTRLITFSDKYLFINFEGKEGAIVAEICRKDGKPIPEYTREDCFPANGDSTKYLMKWKNRDNLEELSGKPVRIKFYLNRSKLFSFWISKNQSGTSSGAVAAGGPGFTGQWDI